MNEDTVLLMLQLGTIIFNVSLYIYIIYRLYKGVVKWQRANNTAKVMRNIIITAIICFPVAAVEMFYVFIQGQKNGDK